EDGIRDRNVTGVQTCALPICSVCVVPGMDILLTDWSMNGMHAAATTTIAAAIIIFCIPFFLGFFVDGPSFPVAITADFFSCFGGDRKSVVKGMRIEKVASKRW